MRPRESGSRRSVGGVQEKQVGGGGGVASNVSVLPGNNREREKPQRAAQQCIRVAWRVLRVQAQMSHTRASCSTGATATNARDECTRALCAVEPLVVR